MQDLNTKTARYTSWLEHIKALKIVPLATAAALKIGNRCAESRYNTIKMELFTITPIAIPNMTIH